MTAGPWVEWFGVLAIEGEDTGDGRTILPGAIQDAPGRLPAPLYRMVPTEGRAWTSPTEVGRIEEWARRGSLIVARGQGDIREREPVGLDTTELVADMDEETFALTVRSAAIAAATLSDHSGWDGRAYVEPAGESPCIAHTDRQLSCSTCYPISDVEGAEL